jgi:hypothetical protein
MKLRDGYGMQSRECIEATGGPDTLSLFATTKTIRGRDLARYAFRVWTHRCVTSCFFSRLLTSSLYNEVSIHSSRIPVYTELTYLVWLEFRALFLKCIMSTHVYHTDIY